MIDICSKDLDNRLASIEGHIRGVRQMLEEKKPCEDIMMQLSAISAAIQKANKNLLESHIKYCIKNSIEKGDFEIIDRLVQVIDKYK